MTIDTAKPHVVCENLVKIYKIADLEVVALQGLNLSVNQGELLGIVGNSGSGKTTVLNIVGGLDRPSAGACSVGGIDLVSASDGELAHFKREDVGFVWQQSSRNLVPYLSAVDNVELPMLFSAVPAGARRARARELLDTVGLTDRMQHKPSALSGGEQQRVAIAVALANDPDLLLADEPTGEVDNETAATIYQALRRLNQERELTVIIVTHDRNITQVVDRVVAIRDGRTSTETVRRVGAFSADAAAHEEFVIVDEVGRLQIPAGYIEELGIEGRVTVEVEDGGLVVRPAPGAGGEAKQSSRPGLLPWRRS